jgi:hypothetical protein
MWTCKSGGFSTDFSWKSIVFNENSMILMKIDRTSFFARGQRAFKLVFKSIKEEEGEGRVERERKRKRKKERKKCGKKGR